MRATGTPCAEISRLVLYISAHEQESAQANIPKADLALLRSAATEALKWSNEELERLAASGALVEIEDDGNGEG